MDGGLGGQNGLGKGGGVLLWEGEDVERQPLGGFDADAGQAGELLHQIFQCGGKYCMGKTSGVVNSTRCEQGGDQRSRSNTTANR